MNYLPFLGLVVFSSQLYAQRHPQFEPALPANQIPNECKNGELSVALASPHVRYSRMTDPADPSLNKAQKSPTAWRGERVNLQLLVLGGSKGAKQVWLETKPLTAKNTKIPVSAKFLRFTNAKNKQFADIIDPIDRVDVAPGESRSIWVQTDIPANAKPGTYTGEVIVHTQENPKGIPVSFNLTVIDQILPSSKNWKFHLDLWQHPQAIARWHNVEPWSDQHFALMKPYMKRLAEAGQKNITCSIIDEPWGGQTYDWFPSLIDWKRDAAGKFYWDFTKFKKWIDFMHNDAGIDGYITCYSMLPWHLKVKYFDEASNSYKDIKLDPNQPEFETVWGEFLTQFRSFLKKNKWLDKTAIALDERPDAMINKTFEVIKKYAPEFKLVSAMNRPTKATDGVFDFSIAIHHANSVSPDLLAKRHKEGKLSTVYVCTSPAVPNTFTHSPLAEGHWIPMFAAARGFDGMLRWAYNSWNFDPFQKSDFGSWPPGDCFLVYPGNLSTPQFESLRDGIEDFEKIQILRQQAAKKNASAELKERVNQLNTELTKRFTDQRAKGNTHAEDVDTIQGIINQ